MQTLIAPAVNTPYTITHGLNSLHPLVQLWLASGPFMLAEVSVVDASRVQVTFKVAPPGDVNVVVAAGIPVSGGGGGGAQAFRYVQASAATTWTIDHGLSFRPNVSAVDSTGTEMFPGSVKHMSDTQVVLTFSAAVGGEAYLS